MPTDAIYMREDDVALIINTTGNLHVWLHFFPGQISFLLRQNQENLADRRKWFYSCVFASNPVMDELNNYE